VRVRRAVADDAPAIATVYVRSWQAAFVGLVPQSYLDDLDPDSLVDTWHRTLQSTDWPRRGVFVLLDDPDDAPDGAHSGRRGRVSGFVCLSPSRDADADAGLVGEIQTLYLEPEAFGTGAAVLLMTAALDELRSGGFRSASLWALETNDRARRFYERHGWRPDGATKRNDWGAFVRTDVRYLLDLGAPGGGA
jgi:GNAT superfamily N-acetyltransferase